MALKIFLRTLFNDTHPIFNSNIRNIPSLLKSLDKDPDLAKGEVACLMCTWQEQYMIKYAIESSHGFVSKYYIVDKDGETIPKIKEVIDELDLDVETYIKPDLNLRESRAYCLDKIKEPWILHQDGDEVFHTDGPQNINNLRKYMDRPNVTYCAPMICIVHDFNHVKKQNPIQPPHEFLYHNSGTVSIAEESQDLLFAKNWKIGFKIPLKFNCKIKQRQVPVELEPYDDSVYGPKPKVIRCL